MLVLYTVAHGAAGSSSLVKASSAVFALLTTGLLGAWLHGTPALRRYTDWDAAGRNGPMISGFAPGAYAASRLNASKLVG